MARNYQTVLLLAVLLLAAGGCKKKQKKVPSAAQAPTITAPAPAPETAVTTVPVSPAENPPPQTEPPKTKPRPRPKPPVKKPATSKPPVTEPAKPQETTSIAKATPPRIVVQPPSTVPDAPTTVVPDMSHTEESHHRQTTEQLMQSTEANLKSLKRVLTAEERGLLQQIQLFMAQSREATAGQDLVRAHNLALKAHLLSDELVR